MTNCITCESKYIECGLLPCCICSEINREKQKSYYERIKEREK